MSVSCQGNKENKTDFFASIKLNVLHLNASQIHTQLLLIDSVAEEMTQYSLYFFLPFVTTIRDV